MSGKFFQTLATTFAVTGLMLSSVPNISSLAATPLRNDQSVTGVIRPISPTFRYINTARRGNPIEIGFGEEYTFNAKQGDTIEVSIGTDNRTNLQPVLVLFSSEDGKQVAFEDRTNTLRYRVPTGGEYRLLVLGQNNSKGRYTLSLSGITENATTQTPTTQPTATDPRRQVLQNEYGLRTLDNCPENKNSLVAVTFREYGQTYTYCANPNRFVKAGEYNYDISTGELKPRTVATQNPTTQATVTDTRKQRLQNEFGLTVMDNCPAARTSLVVVSYLEGGQTYTYCANPNRVFPAGEYSYNPNSRTLEAARKQQQCTVEIGGICLVR